MSDFIAVNAALFRLLTPFGVTISRIYYCPHSAADACDCRTPAPGMLLRAQREFGIEAGWCFMVGDRDVDAAAGQSAGFAAALVGAGAPEGPWPRFATFAEAAAWILQGLRPLSSSAGDRCP
jgi:D-glycero-D-manno-heptose 1,7-bisphosphate phosphatase